MKLHIQGSFAHVEGDFGSQRVTEQEGEWESKSVIAGAYPLTLATPDWVVFGKKTNTRVLMSGEIINRTTMLEIINVITNASWRGELHVFQSIEEKPYAHRTLGVDNGNIRYALSDHPDDRLGQVLFQHGILSKPQLDDAIAESGGKKMGQYLVDKKIITQDQLFSQLQKQVEQIFLSALVASEGQYIFLILPDDVTPPPHSVYLPLTSLLMEGVQHVDEMSLFRTRIPHDNFVVEVMPRVSLSAIDPSAQLVLSYCDGHRTIDAVARDTGLGHFPTLKHVYGFLGQGLVTLKQKKVLDASEIRNTVDQFNGILKYLFQVIHTTGRTLDIKQTLESWIDASGYIPLFGAEIEPDGTINPDLVVLTLPTFNPDIPLEMLHKAFHELISFALFSATTVLPKNLEVALAKEVTLRLKRIH